MAMEGENRPLVTNEPIEFGKQPVEVQDFGKATNHFRKYTSNSYRKTERCQHVTG